MATFKVFRLKDGLHRLCQLSSSLNPSFWPKRGQMTIVTPHRCGNVVLLSQNWENSTYTVVHVLFTFPWVGINED